MGYIIQCIDYYADCHSAVVPKDIVNAGEICFVAGCGIAAADSGIFF